MGGLLGTHTQLESINQLMPDQQQFLSEFNINMHAGAMRKSFGGEHVFMLSCCACLTTDVTREFSASICFKLLSDRVGLGVYIKRDQALHGKAAPPCFNTLVREYVKSATRDVAAKS